MSPSKTTLYLLFTGNEYYPEGGANDFRTGHCVDSDRDACAWALTVEHRETWMHLVAVENDGLRIVRDWWRDHDDATGGLTPWNETVSGHLDASDSQGLDPGQGVDPVAGMTISERDPLEDAYQRGRESGIVDERERAIKAGVFREGKYVEPPSRTPVCGRCGHPSGRYVCPSWLNKSGSLQVPCTNWPVAEDLKAYEEAERRANTP